MTSYLFKHKFWLALTVIVGVVESLFEVYIALLIQQLIDYISGGDMDGFLSVITFGIGFFIAMGIMEYVRSTLQALYIKKTLMTIKEKVFKGILAKDYASFYECNTADYLSHLTNDMNLLEVNYISPYLLMIGDFVIFIGTTILICWINIWVALSIFAMGAFLSIVPSLFGYALKRRQNLVSEQQSVFTMKLKDILEGYEVVKSYRMTNSVRSEFDSINDKTETYKFKSAHLKAMTQSIAMVLAIGTQVAAMAIGGYFVLNGDMTVGMLFAVIQLAGGIQGAIKRLMERMTMIKGMTAVNQKLMTIIQAAETIDEEETLTQFKTSILLDNVSFAYEKKPVLNKVSYTFEKNKKYAIVGESGCGKSTLIKLMMGYYRNYDGTISVDGQDVNGVKPLSVTALASMIHQNVYLFDKSIAENILLEHEFNETQLDRALNRSGVVRFISQLTDGLQTAVGENGKNLSGGQKQRVAIARALIQEMPILILDEGTSSLDLQTAYDIEKTLLSIDDLTVITITHKLSDEILSQYDEIIVMDHGQIVQSGTFDELLHQQGAFYDLYMLKHDEFDLSLAG